MKARAATTNDITSNIIANGSASLNKAAKAKLSSQSSLTKTMQRVRTARNPQPPCPTSIDFDIPESYQKLKDDEKFLYYDSREHGITAYRTLIFSTEENLNVLESCETWGGDGTFDIAPKIFQQLYTIHGEVNRQALPLVYILTTSKSKKVYVEILQQLKIMNSRLNPKTIIADFEVAFLKAVEEVFPSAVIRGCFFHFSKCIWNQICKCNLKNDYESNNNFAMNLKMLSALAMVPTDDVVGAYTKVIKCAFYTANEAKCDKLLKYIEKTWIGKLNRQSERDEPLFARALWNQYESVLQDEARTNNSVEAWHRSFSRRAGCDHPPVWRLIDIMRTEQALTELKLTHAESGESPGKRKRVYENIDARIHGKKI